MSLTLQESIREYYGRVLQHRNDLKTSACCTAEPLPDFLQEAVAQLHPEVGERFYGCGSPIPFELRGRTVLDLGCGSGRDVYLLSWLVGPEGLVLGVDMTDEQLAVARRHQEYHRVRFGHPRSNVRFLKGYIEDLASLGIEDESVDVVVSNCVLNLSPDKPRVFSEIHRVLVPGGELLLCDVVADRRVPSALAQDPVLVGECLGGALYTEDLRRIAGGAGFADLRTVNRCPITLQNPELERRAGMIGFSSVTVRAFKLDDLEDRCENYGQVVWYRGSIPESPHVFRLDDHHRFPAGLPVPVCGNTASMLSRTRYAPHFGLMGDRSVHYGLFPCGPPQPAGGGCC